jgi:hypothetical protein
MLPDCLFAMQITMQIPGRALPCCDVSFKDTFIAKNLLANASPAR